LRYLVAQEVCDMAHTDLSTLNRNVVLLGEAGGGKTRLTEWLGERDGHSRCTARQLLNGDGRQLLGNSTVLVIDALDEVAVRGDGDAVDLVLRALRDAGHPRFVLSCRSSEWRAATMVEAIREQYGEPPLEVELVPLDAAHARLFLTDRFGDAERAKTVVDHFLERGLADWLGNPQTLLMLGDVAGQGPLPETTSALFETYVDLAWHEHNGQRPNAPLQALGKEAVLDALGSGFAALILTGSAALSDQPRHKVARGDLPRADVAALPDATNLVAALGSRLCVGPQERRAFQHKRIGEYLGARWLAKHADTPGKRTALLGLVTIDGLVPSSLRGLHAWLAMHSVQLAEDVIRTDPAGVIEYGDADTLTHAHGRILLDALQRLAERNPQFFVGYAPRAGSLVAPNLINEVWSILTERTADDSAFAYSWALRITLARQIKEEQLVAERRDALVAMMLDERQEFAIRADLGKALAQYGKLANWPDVLETLRCRATENSTRLAVDLLDDIGFEHISDQQIVDLILAYEGVTLSAVPREASERRTVGTLYFVRRELPEHRIEGVLDTLAEYLAPFGDDFSLQIDNFDVSSLIGDLVVRRLDQPLSDPISLWRWLRPLQGNRGYIRSNRDEVAEWLSAHPAERRSIQRHVLLDRHGDHNLWQRRWRLLEPLPAAQLSEDDVIALLDNLEPADERWREVMMLTPQEGVEGQRAREAAKRFAAGDAEKLAWIEAQAHRPPPDWEIEQEQRSKRRKREQAKKFAKHRKAAMARRDELRRGNYSDVVSPARAYLGQFSDIEREAPPHERIAGWLGDDLQADAFAGFEAFLQISPPDPDAQKIAESWANSRVWHAAYIVVAALMERQRTERGFGDLPDERLIAGMIQLEHGLLRSDEGKALGAALEAELVAREGAFERYARLLIEPHLNERATHITGLYGLMRDTAHADLGTRLAQEWLNAFPGLAAEIEEEFTGRLIAAREVEQLRDFAAERLALPELGERRRRNWQAIALWTDFATVAPNLTGVGASDPTLLWSLRDRIGGGRHRDDPSGTMSIALMGWIVREFRAAFPRRERPDGVTSGDTNAWDASDYIAQLVGQIGENTGEEAVEILTALRDAPGDGYTDYLRRVVTEQAAKRAEQSYTPPTLDRIARIVSGALPTSQFDLQAVVLDALDRVQARVRSDEADSWVGFYRDDRRTPKEEEACSDHLKLLLDAAEPGIVFAREPHLGSDREADFWCSVPGLGLPIEAKGQWHQELWRAAESQLGDQQAVDYRAEGYGIYLVYWFGPDSPKRLQGPPRGTMRPTSRIDLEKALGERLIASGRPNLLVKVLDLARPVSG
jgi:hypothetical protein